jgi:hypothetical protein
MKEAVRYLNNAKEILGKSAIEESTGHHGHQKSYKNRVVKVFSLSKGTP